MLWCHAWIVFDDIIDEEAEDARLRCDIEKLRGDAQRKMFAPEHIPVFGNQNECSNVRGNQQSVFCRLEQCLVHIKHRPNQPQNRGNKEIQQPADNNQRDANGRKLPRGRFKSGLLFRGFLAFVVGVQIRDIGKNKDHEQDGNKYGYAQVGNVKAGVGVRTFAAGKDKLSADNRAENPAPAVERLGDVDARRATFRWAEQSGVRIGNGFQTGHARCDDKQTQ